MILSLFFAVCSGAFTAGTRIAGYTDIKKTGIAARSGDKSYANCKFLTLNDDTVMQMFWTVGQEEIEVGLAMDSKKLEQGGWWAVGVSNSPVDRNAMQGGNIVIGYIDRENSGFGFVQQMDSIGTVAPRFTSPDPNVTDSSIGISQVVIGKDDLAIMEFTRPVADWGGVKTLIFSYRTDSAMDANTAPPAGSALASLKHTGRNFISNFDFATPSKQCEPPTPPDPNDPCSLLDSFNGIGHVADLAGGQVKIDWTIDCVAKDIEFVVEGTVTGDGWLAIGFNTEAIMPGTDAYQMWVAPNGDVKVQNGFSAAKGAPSGGQSEFIAGATVQKSGDNYKYTFKRPLAAGEPGKDVDFAFGRKYFINVAKKDDNRDPNAKHNVRTPGSTLVDFFALVGELPPPPPPVEPVGGCGDLKNDIAVNSVLFESGAMLNMEIDCRDESILFTLSAQAQGWIAFGFSESKFTMPGSDTYQLWLNAAGQPVVRNGHAVGRNIEEDGNSAISDISGSENNGWVTVSFRRKFDTGSPNDVVFGQGRKYFVNFASAAVTTPTVKHTFKESTNEAVELFENAGPVIGGPCLNKDKFVNSISLPLDGNFVRIDMAVDCVAAVAEYTVTGETDGWLSFGFSDDKKMKDTDTLQVSFNGGKAIVRDGYATGQSTPNEDDEFNAIRASKVDGILSVTFKRKLYTGLPGDRVLFAGRPVYVHVAKASSEDFTDQHSDRTPGAAPIELFEEAGEIEPIVPNPCQNQASSFSSYADVAMDGSNVEIDWTIDCVQRTIEFTVRGEADGWLGVGFTKFNDKMSGADTYQMRGGSPIRNGRAEGRQIVEDLVIVGSSAELVDGVMTGTWKRDLESVRASDVAFTPGDRWFINVARRNEDNDWLKKHTFRDWSDDSFEFFEDRTRPKPTEKPAPAPANVDRVNKIEVSADGKVTTIDYEIDCDKEEVEFTVSGPFSDGWFSFGFNPKSQMAGTDIYQLRVDGTKGEVRNAIAEGKSVTEESVFDAISASVTGGVASVTFRRSLKGEKDDLPLAPGNEYHINVAYHTDSDWKKQHLSRGSSANKIDLFKGFPACGAGGAPGKEPASGGNPCDKEDKFSNTYYIELGDDVMEIEYEIDCEDEEIEFTLIGSMPGEDGWLAIGFADEKEEMKETDTYQVRFNSDDDEWEVRNSYATGLKLPEEDTDEIDEAEDGEFEDGLMKVTFKRKFDTGEETDRPLLPGKGWYINVAYSTKNDWETKHEGRNWSSKRIDLFTEEPWEDPREPAMVNTDSATSLVGSLMIVMMAAFF